MRVTKGLCGIASAAVLLAVPVLAVIAFGMPTTLSAGDLPNIVASAAADQVEVAAINTDSTTLLSNWAYTGNNGCGNDKNVGNAQGSPNRTNNGKGGDGCPPQAGPKR